jgi:AAA domain, putative AbiEii toxin, Type IV TA system
VRLLGLAVEDFRSIHDQWITADALAVFFGPNSAGKTSVLEAAKELLGGGSQHRTDPGLVEEIRTDGTIWFTLPTADVSGSPDARLYQELLAGENLFGTDGPGSDTDRATLALSVLNPSTALFVSAIGGISLHVGGVPAEAMEAAHRIAACEGPGDVLWDIAMDLSAGRQRLLGPVAARDAITGALPPVITLDGDMDTLRTDMRQAVPVIHDLLWEVSYPRSRLGSSGYSQFIDGFAIRHNEGASEYYMGDPWLEWMSDSGEPEVSPYEQGPGWYRVRHSVLAVAALIADEANRVAPGFLREQGRIGIEVLPVSVWGTEDRRIRATFTSSDGEPRDLRVVGAGTARWAAAAVQLACRRLEKGRRVVTDQAGAVTEDPAAVEEIVHAARKEPMSQAGVRLEPAEAPGVYIVDEPEAHLHPRAVASVRGWLEELARTATAVLAATHSPMLLDTDSPLATRVLVLPGESGTELHTITGPIDERLAELADDLGMTKGDLLLMTRLVLFVEGEHDVIILSEMFGSELRDAGIRVFPAHGGDNFAELAVTKPGLVGGEIIGALGIRMAVVLDTSPTRVEPTVNRMVREAEAAGRQVTAVRLSEDDILYYLDEEICRKHAPRFPGWHEARDAARDAKARKWKTWVTDRYGLDLSPGNIRRLAAECRKQGRIPAELARVIQTLTALAVSPRAG